jgi:hypothetical protein
MTYVLLDITCGEYGLLLTLTQACRTRSWNKSRDQARSRGLSGLTLARGFALHISTFWLPLHSLPFQATGYFRL